jgi:hypothetical protein
MASQRIPAMRVILGAMIVLLLNIQIAAADGIGGWPLLHWGMTKQQVERAYPNFEYYDHIFPIGGPRKVLGLQEYSAAGCNFAVWLEFHDNELFEIQLEAIIKKGDIYDRFCKAKDALFEAYGQPEVSNLIPGEPIYTWTTGDTQVNYSGGPFGNGFRDVGIAYTKRDWFTTPHGKKRL